MTNSEFLKKQGETFHIRLLKFYYLMTSQEEQQAQKDDDVLFFEFDEGKYSITFLDLKEEADKETIELFKRNNVDLPSK